MEIFGLYKRRGDNSSRIFLPSGLRVGRPEFLERKLQTY
jgi:hypothetical protein